MTLAANDATDRVEQLIALTERLTVRLEAETRLFEARRPQEVARTAPETLELTNLYRREATQVRANPSLISGAPGARRNKLIEVTRVFEAVVARHGSSVKAARIVTEGVVRAIAEEVVAKRMPAAGYGPRARARQGDASAITLNRRA
ncbi:MAG: flagellar basal-body protein FlbY [Caulobacteraceae bacterium]